MFAASTFRSRQSTDGVDLQVWRHFDWRSSNSAFSLPPFADRAELTTLIPVRNPVQQVLESGLRKLTSLILQIRLRRRSVRLPPL